MCWEARVDLGEKSSEQIASFDLDVRGGACESMVENVAVVLPFSDSLDNSGCDGKFCGKPNRSADVDSSVEAVAGVVVGTVVADSNIFLVHMSVRFLHFFFFGFPFCFIYVYFSLIQPKHNGYLSTNPETIIAVIHFKLVENDKVYAIRRKRVGKW